MTLEKGFAWIQGGSAAGGNSNRLTTTSGMPGNMQYNVSRRGTQIYANGIAFADPYNGNSNNDSAWIRHIEETGNAGILEIATGDDANNEEIHLRWYNTSNTISHDITVPRATGTLIHSGNISSQSVNYATSAGSVAWGNVTGKPSSYTPASHSHDYLPLSGGQITGKITRDSGGAWIAGRDNAIIRTLRTSGQGADWHPAVAVKTSSGCWTFGSVGGETLCLSYDTDTNYNSGRNDAAVINFPSAGSTGTIALTSQIPSTISWSNVTGRPFENSGYFLQSSAWNWNPFNASTIQWVAGWSFKHSNSSDTGDLRFYLSTNPPGCGGQGICMNIDGYIATLSQIYAGNGMYVGSDRNLKKAIQNIPESSLDELFSVSDKLLKKFTLKSSNRDSYGFIAQQLEKYIPEAINEDSNGIKSVSYDVAYAKIIASLVYKIKVLEAKVESSLHS